MQDFSPVKAIFELEFSLEMVAGRNVRIEASFFGRDKADKAERVGIGEAGLAGFDQELERRIVFDPGALGRVEVGV
jgi:hypothetical protein